MRKTRQVLIQRAMQCKDITGTVLIAEFRLPDLREKYAALEEEVTNTQLAIVELYEGGEA